MHLRIPRDYFDNPTQPIVFLCNTAKKRLGQLHAYDIKLNAKWNSYSTLEFSIDRKYTNTLTGESVVDPLFNKVEGPRQVEVQNIGFFIIQDPSTQYGEKDTKSVSCFSAEYACASKYLDNFHINTSEEDSKEVIYLSTLYGNGYTIDDKYTLASGVFDAYESYYIKDYTDADSYTWQQEQITDASAYATYDGTTVAKTLYVKKYPNVRFYWPTKPQLSLLHLVIEKIPGWTIGNVDTSLWRKERKFSEDRISVYDFIMNNVTDTFRAVFEWDTINSVLNVYEEAEDGITENDTIQTRFDTDVFISCSNLMNECDVKYSVDDVKTKLQISGADDLDIREVNLGRNSIINLDYYYNEDWMEPDLLEAYGDYLDAIEEYTPRFNTAMQGWVAANNKWNGLMNAVPAENDVLLVGDDFNKLYCVFSPINNAYLPIIVTDSNIGGTVTTLYSDEDCTEAIDKTMLDDNRMFTVQNYAYLYDNTNDNFICDRKLILENVAALIKKLNLYHVDDDTNASATDNILLRLKNTADDVAIIRIYDPKKMADNTYDPTIQYYSRINDTIPYKYDRRSFSDASAYNTFLASTPLYTNDYKINYIITRAASGIASEPVERSLTDWVSGILTTDNDGVNGYNELDGFKISYIGTMGAYFCLAKNEIENTDITQTDKYEPTDYLKSFGVNLLKNKQKTYLTLFQSQIEALYSQDKYQCIISTSQPVGTYPNGTRWFDSDANPATLWVYTNGNWEQNSGTLSSSDQKNYENYQRYLDNFNKLRAVQEVLLAKEKEAEYCLNGYAVSNRSIDMNLYEHGSGYGQSLEADLQRAAAEHFGIAPERITRVGAVDGTYPLYKFTIPQEININVYTNKPTTYNKYDIWTVGADYQPSGYTVGTVLQATRTSSTYSDIHWTSEIDWSMITTYAVYLKGKTPYIAYDNSQGVYQMMMNKFSELTEMKEFFTEDQWVRLSPFIREDSYENSNILLTGYESEEERLEIYNELLSDATKELKKIAQPSLEFSMTMANILALPEFTSILEQFELGNFVRIALCDDLVKRARLLEVNINFSDLSDFSATFGNLVQRLDEIDKHAELMSVAISAGKQVATSASDWQKAVDKSNKLEMALSNGLADSALNIGRASGQAISWDSTGMHFRKFKPDSTTEFEPEEMAIINSSLVATNDSWKTSKAAFGKYVINGEERWGPISEHMNAGLIEASQIIGGSMRIGQEGGTQFIVSEDGSVQIKSENGQTVSTDSLTTIQDARRFHTELVYSGSTVFSEPNSSVTITAKVFSWDSDITANLSASTRYSWIRSSRSNDVEWNALHANQSSNTITITNADINNNAQFNVSIVFDDTNL